MMFPFQVSCLCKWTEHILISPMEEIPTAAFHAICNTKISWGHYSTMKWKKKKIGGNGDGRKREGEGEYFG